MRKLAATLLLVLGAALTAHAAPVADGFRPLFPKDGAPAGWVVRPWDDLAQPAPPNTEWTVRNGTLQPGNVRGTWLMSEKEYADFVLEFEIKLGPYGNSGVALRSPMRGDPAFDGMELQFADVRYNVDARPNELTGAIYRAIAPRRQLYRPNEWNRCQVTLQGPKLRVVLNGETIQDADLRRFVEPTLRHDGTNAPPLKDRPLRGHIGFQHLSRLNEPIAIRGARIKELRAEG